MKPDREKDDYIASLKYFSERELLELQTYYARKTMDDTKSINNKVQFFYILHIIGILVFLIYMYNIGQK